MENKDSFKLSKDTDNIVELLYDTPKTGVNNYGAWYLYGVRKDGRETSFFATENLHKQLIIYGQGAKVIISKEEYAPNKFAWTVKPQSGTKPMASSPSTSNTIDARTHDIHKQVCLKLSVEMFGSVDGRLLSNADLITIDANMKSLLQVLESTDEDEEIVKDLTSDEPVKNDDMPF